MYIYSLFEKNIINNINEKACNAGEKSKRRRYEIKEENIKTIIKYKYRLIN